MPEDRRLAAIMFTDIVGYTALMGSDEDKAFKMLRNNREIQRPIIKKYRGEWLKEMGDGILASFYTASDAVRCAGKIQQAVKKEGIALRIGIHEGEVVFEGGDVLGDGVNVASRLEEMADEGCINISGAVYKDIKNKAGITAEFIEEKTLKNVEEPVKVYKVHFEEKEEPATFNDQPAKIRNKLPFYIIAGLLVVIVAILIWQFLPTKDTDPQTTEVTTEVVDKSIAVLPFRNDSPDQDNEYFCNGMVETILTNLQKIEDLRVKSRTSAEQYRNPDKDLMVIAKELNVAFILEGSVQKAGDKIRITAQLIDGGTGDHVWAETYDGKYTDKIFEFQSNVARQVAFALKAEITPEEEQRIERTPTSNIKAFDLYVRGHYENLNYWRTLDKKHLRTAHDLYDRAIEIDREFLLAITGKGLTFMAERKYDSAMLYADKVIALDPDFNRGYGSKGECYFFMGKSDLAIENYLKAINLPPQDDTWLWYHVALGRAYVTRKSDVIAGLSYIKKGLDFSSKVDLRGVYTILGASYLHIGDYKKAEEYLLKANELGFGCIGFEQYMVTLRAQSNYQKALHFLDSICSEQVCENPCSRNRFYIYLELKEFELAEQDFNQLLKVGGFGENPWIFQIEDSVLLAYMYKKLGNEQDAFTILNNFRKSFEVQLTEDKTFITNLNLSLIHAIQGEREKALSYLSNAVEIGLIWGWHDRMQVHPIFESLWDDPEFKAIVKRAQDEKAGIRAQVREAEERGELDL